MRRAERLSRILRLLQIHEILTAEDLAEELEVNVRTVYRDMDDLSLHYPICSVAGHGGGYSLLDNYKLGPELFSTIEIATLSIGNIAVSGMVDLLDEDAEIQYATEKLLSTLTETEQELVKRQHDYILFDRSRWYRKYAYKETLRIAKNAVLHDRRIEIVYFSRDDFRSDLRSLVDAYGLVFKSDTWYLVGFSSLEERIRSWSMERITRITITDEVFHRPKDFSLSNWWKQQMELFGQGDTRVLLAVHKRVWHKFKRMTWKKSNRFAQFDDSVIIELWVDNYQWILDLLLMSRGDVRVLEPQSLKDDLVEAAHRVLGTIDKPSEDLTPVTFVSFDDLTVSEDTDDEVNSQPSTTFVDLEIFSTNDEEIS